MKTDRLFLIFLGAWALLFCGLRTAQHFSFGTNANDLSVYDYGLRSTLKGKVMAEPFHQYSFGHWERESGSGTLTYKPGAVKGWQSYFSLHFTPILFFIAPLYAIFPSALLLLYLQVLAAALAALFLFLVARSVLAERGAPWVVAVAYLFFRQSLIGLTHDFHPELLFPPLFLGGFYFLVVRKKRVAAFALLLSALLVKEDVGIYLFFFGLFAALKLKEKKFGWLTAATALGYTLLVLGVVIPAFRQGSGAEGFYQYSATYGQIGGGLAGMVGHILGHPQILFQGVDLGAFSRILCFGLLLPLLFLPLASWYGLLLIPPLAVAVFSKIPQFYTFGIFYSSALLPFLFLALIYGLKNVRDHWTSRRPDRGRRIFVAVAWIILVANIGNSSFWRIVQPGRYRALSTYSDVRALASLIPPDASVAAQSALVPHLPQRRTIAMLPGFGHEDYVFIHAGVNPWPYTQEELIAFNGMMQKDPSYELAGQRGVVRLYRRKRT